MALILHQINNLVLFLSRFLCLSLFSSPQCNVCFLDIVLDECIEAAAKDYLVSVLKVSEAVIILFFILFSPILEFDWRQ